MNITPEAIIEFKQIYEAESKTKLSDQQALAYGNRLICLIKAVYGNQLPNLKTIDNIKSQIQN